MLCPGSQITSPCERAITDLRYIDMQQRVTAQPLGQDDAAPPVAAVLADIEMLRADAPAYAPGTIVPRRR